ncbi:MAG: FMN-binding protein [Eubacteriales bacterium]
MIRNLFNLITAWLSVVLLIMVVVIWIFRILVQKKIVSKESFIYKANRMLRKYHKFTGIGFLAVALVHGVLSSAELLSINWGSASFFFILFMSIGYLIKKKMTRKVWLNIHRALTAAVAITFIIHLFDVGISGINLLKTPAASLDKAEITMEDLAYLTDESAIASDGTIQYSDGVYTGVADGYGPDLTVEVTIENNLITNVDVVSHNEVNERFWSLPIAQLPCEIVKAQSIEVDSISGATYTSVGIKNAVLDALSQAIIYGELPNEEAAPTGGHRHGGGHGGGEREELEPSGAFESPFDSP